jgi:hypothetical protein
MRPDGPTERPAHYSKNSNKGQIVWIAFCRVSRAATTGKRGKVTTTGSRVTARLKGRGITVVENARCHVLT